MQSRIFQKSVRMKRNSHLCLKIFYNAKFIHLDTWFEYGIQPCNTILHSNKKKIKSLEITIYVATILRTLSQNAVSSNAEPFVST